MEFQHIKKYLLLKTAVKISLKGESLLARVRDGPFYTEFDKFLDHISEHSASQARQRFAGNTIERAITLSDIPELLAARRHGGLAAERDKLNCTSCELYE